MTKADAKAPPAEIRRYLKATGLIELRYIRKLSSLCAQTYYIRKLTVRLCWSGFCGFWQDCPAHFSVLCFRGLGAPS